ncbi:NACHT domain protein [Pyrenochaeta sp. MPI-SDFR-AT-0127]|nr:NACHT domain protein [Pyrenochaeta sp. MPI-SDFR-AT-0127]
MAAHDDPVQQVFENIVQEFRTNLKNDELYNELLKTTSIDDVYDATDKLQHEQSKNGQLRHLSKIEPYLEGLRGYASIVEVFMQAKPEILALIWGPIKLLLQMTSVLKQSLDAIIDTTADIGVRLPEFKKSVDLFGHNTHIKELLAMFFKDILDFYLVSLRFFSLPRWKYFFESLWPKQRDKIKVIINHIERHTMLMRNGVRLEHIQAEHDARARALEHFENTEKAHQRQEYQSIRTEISPRTYGNKLDWLHARRCDGTGTWLIKDPVFASWIDIKDASTTILWLQGIPGSGKTFLSSNAVNETQNHGRTLYAFLSYTFSNNVSALSIIHSLIFQLASFDDDLQAILCQSSRQSLKSSIDASKTLLSTLLHRAGPVFIIVDGLDEIDRIERSRLLKYLLDIGKDCSETKLLISSRPEADITDILRDQSKVIRVDNRNSGSIQTFITHHTLTWFEERQFLPEAQADIERFLAPLASNSRGMFLYAKIILSSIEHLEVEEIQNDIRILPETLDDAYARVLQRINNLGSPIMRQKARKILGWIGSSTKPLTIHELEQALLVDPKNKDRQPKVTSRLNLIHICGPIIEVVDEYVQFVHFTAQEYFLSPQIASSVDAVESTLGLTLTCITYLCQPHYDIDILDEDIEQNILSGVYRLHNFATTTWLDLLKKYISFDHSAGVPDELVSILETLTTERHNCQYNGSEEPSSPRSLEAFKKHCSKLHTALRKSVHFRLLWAKAAYQMTKEAEWTDLDPLTLSNSSVRIHKQFEAIFRNTARLPEAHLESIRRHYGNRPFKCGFLNCSFRRHGFETAVLRNSHMRYHDRPWSCNFPGCEFENGGFLSRNMRNEHLDKFHREHDASKISAQGKIDENELQPLLFDLVRADKVEGFKCFLKAYRNLPYLIQTELQSWAGQWGSSSMIDLFVPTNIHLDFTFERLLVATIKHDNVEAFRHLLLQYESPSPGGRMDPRDNRGSIPGLIGPEVLKYGCHEIVETWIRLVASAFESGDQSLYLSNYTSGKIISATAGRDDKERILVAIWRRHVFEASNANSLGVALVNVAATTCSIELAKHLIQQGALVDYRRNDQSFTPLQHAARNSTAAGAELLRFLLYHGADPNVRSTRARLQICEEKGAKGIAIWLGISWDELVIQAKEHRKGENSAALESPKP